MSENEGAKFWLGHLTALKNPGMNDMLIACTDHLSVMSEAIAAVYPKTEHQLCIVYPIRNSLEYVSCKHRKTLVYASWDNLMVFLHYPNAIRKVIYTTNVVESVNSQFRRVTKNKRVFANDLAVFKTLYLTIHYMTRKWTTSIHNWSEAMAHFLIKFENRIE